jgi:hypothetical protein
MKSILFELGFRGLYVTLLYAGLALCFYFSFGFQYEYASIFCMSHFQSIDFCFQSLHMPYVNPYIHNTSLTESLNQHHVGNFLHQSKSWGLLSISSVSYFHNCDVDPRTLIWCYKARVLIFVCGLQYWGFALPGVHTNARLKWITIGHIGWSLLVLSTHVIAPCLVIAWELFIEPFDSELILYQS